MRWFVTFTFFPLIFAVLFNPVKSFAVDVLCTFNGSQGVTTALGCVPVEMDKFIAWLLPLVFSIAGTISFLLMVYGFFLMSTSQGDPKVMQGAKETVTSAISGLLICLFAIFLLRLIALDILKIPGL